MQGNGAKENVMGQKVIDGGKGAKAPDYSGTRVSESVGSAPIPKIEGEYCNQPKGQETK